VLTDYLEHGSIVTGIYYADLIRKVQAALKEKRRGKLRHGMLFHQGRVKLLSAAGSKRVFLLFSSGEWRV